MRNIHTGYVLLRKCEDDVFNNIYFTPDLTNSNVKKHSIKGGKKDTEIMYEMKTTLK